MAQAARDLSVNPARSVQRELTESISSIAIGAAGAVDSTIAGYRVSPEVVVANTGAGTFSITYAPCPNCTIHPFIELSPASTVVDAVLTAKSPTAGTATLAVKNAAGANTNPASGDLIGLTIHYLPTGVI